MMSAAAINDLSRNAAIEAAREGRLPLVFEREDLTNPKTPARLARRIPNLGQHRPEGWTPIRALFVDKSGWGAPSEPALTIDAFLRELRPGRGYAMTEEGQFQAYITEFVPPGLQAWTVVVGALIPSHLYVTASTKDAALSLAQSWGYDPKAARQEEPGEDGNYLPGGETFTGEEDPEEADFNFEFDRDDNDEPVEDSGQGYNDTHSYTRHIEGN